MNFYEDGNLLKLKQSGYFTYAGWAVIVIIVIISLAFKLGDVISLAIYMISFVPVYLFNESSYKPNQLIKINQQFGI